MCNTASGIIVEGMKVHFHPDSDSHEDIIDMFNLIDDQVKENRKFLRFEIHPNKSLTSTDVKDWDFILDEDKHDLPLWYLKATIEIQEKCKKELMKLIEKERYLNFKGGLSLNDSKIKVLPENLKIGGDLFLRDSLVKVLPENLTIGGSLFLRDSLVETIPENITIGGSLFLSDSKIKVLPENITIGGSLILSYSLVKVLPDNLTIGGKIITK